MTTTLHGEDDIDWLDVEPSPSTKTYREKLLEDFLRLKDMTTEEEIGDLVNRLAESTDALEARLEVFNLRYADVEPPHDEIERYRRSRIALGHLKRRLKAAEKALNQVRHINHQFGQAKMSKAAKPALSPEEAEGRYLVALEDRKNARMKARLHFIKGMSWDRNFINAAEEILPRDLFRKIAARAGEMLNEKIGLIDVTDGGDDG